MKHAQEAYLQINFIKLMRNRKQEIPLLQAVSKCKKQKFNSTRKTEMKKVFTNIQLISNLDEQYHQPEISQSILNINFSKSNHQHQQQNKKEILYQARDFQDSNLTKHLAEQLLVIKVMMMIVNVLSIFLARIGQDSQLISIYSLPGQQVVLTIHSLFTLSLVIMAIAKHAKIRQLTKKQLIRFSPYQLNFLGINKFFILQLVFLFIHPNLIFEGKTISIKQPVFQQYLRLKVNNLLEIVMLFRVYSIYSAIVSSTIYLSTRGSRICRIYGTNCDLYFGFKCLFNTRPLFFLIVIFLSMLFVFGEMVRLSQEDVQYSNLGQFGNSLWCVMITMGTVGYGDYYPQTYLSRVILFFASITGIIVASLLILTLSTYLSMQLSQNKAHITMHRLVLRDKLQNLAKSVVYQSAIVSRLQEDKGQKQIKQLKKKTDDVRYILRKIKNLIDTDNVNQQMDRLFETLQDNMKDAFINQIRYTQALKQMHEVQADKISEMKFSFTEEIQNVVKDR